MYGMAVYGDAVSWAKLTCFCDYKECRPRDPSLLKHAHKWRESV